MENNFLPELNQPVPRSVRANKRYKWLIAQNILYFVIPAVGFSLLAFMGISQRTVLQERGVAVIGLISDMRTIQANKGTSYNINYRFQPLGGRNMLEKSLTISSGLYDSLHIGQQVPLLYDPQNVNFSMLNFDDSLHKQSPLAGFLQEHCVMVAMFLILIVVLVCSTAKAIKIKNEEEQLVAFGQIIRGSIDSELAYNASRYTWRLSVKYEFTDVDGNQIKGERKDLPLRSSEQPADKEMLRKVFETTAVLFDPQNSNRNMLYPGQYVDCVFADGIVGNS